MSFLISPYQYFVTATCRYIRLVAVAFMVIFMGIKPTFSQTIFPTILAEDVNDKSISIPLHYEGKRTVIGIAFSLKANESLKKWANPLHKTLIAGSMGGLMGGNMYDANLGFVALLKGIAKIGKAEAKQRIKKETDPSLHSLFLFSESDANEIMNHLEIKNTSEPYFFVLDEKGKIITQVSGAYSEEKMTRITDALLQ